MQCTVGLLRLPVETYTFDASMHTMAEVCCVPYYSQFISTNVFLFLFCTSALSSIYFSIFVWLHSSSGGHSFPRGEEEGGVSSVCPVQWGPSLGHLLCEGPGGLGQTLCGSSTGSQVRYTYS